MEMEKLMLNPETVRGFRIQTLVDGAWKTVMEQHAYAPNDELSEAEAANYWRITLQPLSEYCAGAWIFSTPNR
jgi:hypothetical protein